MAAVVKSVESVSGTISGAGSVTINLTKGQDYTQCSPMGVTFRFSSGSLNDAQVNFAGSVQLINNAGTAAVQINRQGAAAGGTIVYEMSIVEWADNVTVQQGGFTEITGTSATAAISSVNTDRSFIVPTYDGLSTETNDGWNDSQIQARFNSSTEIQFERRASGGLGWRVYWYVVTFDNGDIETEYVEWSTTSNTNAVVNATLSNPVDLDHAFIIPTYESSETADDMRDAIWRIALTGTTQITARRNINPNAGATFGVWVARGSASEFTAQRFNTDVASQITTNQTITSVDLDKAAIINGQHTARSTWVINSSTNGSQNTQFCHTLRFTSATNVELQRLSNTNPAGSDNSIDFEVVEFQIAGVGPPPQTVPVDLVSETDSVFAVTPVVSTPPQTVVVGQVEETDSVLDVTPLAGGVTLSVGLVEETDTVFAVTPQTGGAPQTVPVDLITETDSVQIVTPLPGEVTLLVGTVTETDEVFPVTPVPGAVSVSVEIVEELDQIAPVFPVVEGGPQTVLVVNVAEIDTVFPVTPRLEPEEEDIKGGIPPIRRRRKRRRYILPDGRVFTDPERALYELRALLKAERAAGESGGEAAISETTPASLGQEISPPDTATEEPVTPQMLASAVSELPELLLARPENVPSLDPQLISVLFQMIDDEEAAMLLL